MIIRSKKWIIFTLIIISLIVSILFITNGSFDESDKAALYSLVRQELKNYFLQHGCYPQNLNDLNISQFPERTSLSTLRAFDYVAECKSFTCEYRNEVTNRIFIMKGKDGEIISKGFDNDDIAKRWSQEH